MCLVLVSFLGPAGDPNMLKEHLPSLSLWVTPASPKQRCMFKGFSSSGGKGGVLKGLGKKGEPEEERRGTGNWRRVWARDPTPAPPPGTQKVHFLQEAMVIRPGEFPPSPLQFKNGQALIGISQRLLPQKDLHFNALEFLKAQRAFQVCEPTMAPPHWRGLYSWRPLWADLMNFPGLPLKLKSAPRPKLGEANVLPAKGLASQCCVHWKEKKDIGQLPGVLQNKDLENQPGSQD